jgi:UDP-N-acetyl-D-glucosamine dehydrogenase
LTKIISVVGLGYVGLPLSVAAASSRFQVVGIDVNRVRVETINKGLSPIEDISDLKISELIKYKTLVATTEFSRIKESEIIVICVPTPLTADHKPDISILESALKATAPYLKKDMLVILESTVEPGTTRNMVAPLLAKGSGLKQNEFLVAFSPERIDPANKLWEVRNTPKLIAGLTDQACQRAIQFYSHFINRLIKCDSLEIAETSKLLENSFRLINISFINEIAIFCQKLGIDVNAVISAAATKPYGFMPFYPSIGVGGHCIPVDPLYLANKAREIGAPTRFIDLADEINQEIPGYFVGRAAEIVGGLKAKRVLVVGVAYKPNVADVRESPAGALIAGLKQKGAQVFWHDALVQEWNGEKSVLLSSDFDLAIIATPHDYLDLTKLGDVPILNTRESI